MDTLGLVCESHRSTETTSPQEMDLIRCFLPSNLSTANNAGRHTHTPTPTIRSMFKCSIDAQQMSLNSHVQTDGTAIFRDSERTHTYTDTHSHTHTHTHR